MKVVQKGVLQKGVVQKRSCVNGGCFMLGAKPLVGQSFPTFKAAEELITVNPNNS